MKKLIMGFLMVVLLSTSISVLACHRGCYRTHTYDGRSHCVCRYYR